jgi:transposase
MLQQGSKKVAQRSQDLPAGRRRYGQEFKEEAVQMLLDGHTAASVCERLGLSSVNLLYGWKRKILQQGQVSGATAQSLEARVRELEVELRRVERERDILKKALSIFGRDG